jgi:diacylglycerol O-acyltransferase / wax synthase
VAHPDRLTALDSSFLHMERGPTHMHVASCITFRGTPPTHEEFVAGTESRLHLVPRYRQRLATVPLEQGRPVWVDDPYFNPRYHIRHTALPKPGTEEDLKRLAGRVFSQRLDRSKPLWEIWLVEGLSDDRFAILAKTHHALVDGISGVDITTVLFDASPDPAPVAPPEHPWVPRPLPSGAQLLADAMLERATLPAEMVRGVRAVFRGPRRVASGAARSVAGLGAIARASDAPHSPYNVEIGPHRRFTWVDGDLGRFRAIKSALGGTVNDVVLAAVAGALGRHLRRNGHPTRNLVLKAMVPVSVRADLERGALGNRVSAMYAPLPVGVTDPVERLGLIREAMQGLKESGQAVGAEVITQLGEFAPPTIMAQAARLQERQRLFNLVVTNVPGPQFPLYLLGREMERIYPMVPLSAQQSLGIALMSYNGQLNFGLNADYDALPDLEDLATDLRDAIEELAEIAGLARPKRRPRTRRAGPRPTVESTI